MKYTPSAAAIFVAALAACFALLAGPGCSTVEPEADETVVLEGFIDAGQSLPLMRLRRTRPLDARYADDATTAISDADLMLSMDGESVVYRPVEGRPGSYAPQGEAFIASERAAYSVEARWRGHRLAAEGIVPPRIAIDSVRVQVPDEPVLAVLIDSIFFATGSIDSLRADTAGVVATREYVYPVSVTVSWKAPPDGTAADSALWVRTQLKPSGFGSAAAINFFYRPEEVQREKDVATWPDGVRRWSGVYAVPVAGKESPIPDHDLRVGLVRSGADYARFASSRAAPERREPVSNVRGGIGIVAGVSVDTLHVAVSATGESAGKRYGSP